MAIVEVKRAAMDLDSAIRDKKLSMAKYFAQAEGIGAHLVILTTGLQARVFAKTADIAKDEFGPCPTYSCDLLEGSGAAERLSCLRQTALGAPNGLDLFERDATRARVRLQVEAVLAAPPQVVLEAFAGSIGTTPDNVRDALAPQGISVPKPSVAVPRRPDHILPGAKLTKGDWEILRKLSDAGGQKWRARVAAKYLAVWDYILANQPVGKAELMPLVARVVASQKGRATFFGAYFGKRAKTPIFIETGQPGIDHEYSYVVRAPFREAFSEMVKLVHQGM